MATRPFPRDAIEATAARLKYGLDHATYSRLAAQLHAWRLGSAIFHSDGELLRLIRSTARSEPAPRANLGHRNATV
jgi:hypothetical protein